MAATKKTGEKPSERARRLGPPTADRLKKKKARTRKVQVALDDELAAEVSELKRELERLQLRASKTRANTGNDDPELKTELEAKTEAYEKARDQLREETVTMVFRAIGRKRYNALVEEHPPTAEQKAEAKKEETKKPDFNSDTFPQALVALSCAEPDLTEGAYEDEDTGRMRYPLVEDIFDEWNDGELGTIFTAAYQVNTMRQVVDVGEG